MFVQSWVPFLLEVLQKLNLNERKKVDQSCLFSSILKYSDFLKTNSTPNYNILLCKSSRIFGKDIPHGKGTPITGSKGLL